MLRSIFILAISFAQIIGMHYGSCARADELPARGGGNSSDQDIVMAIWDSLVRERSSADRILLRQALEKNDQAALERLLGEFIKENPRNGSVYLALRGMLRQRQYRLSEAIDDYKVAQTRGGMQRDLKGVVQRRKREIEQVYEIGKKTQQDPAYLLLLRDVRVTIHQLIEQNDDSGLDAYLGTLFQFGSVRPYATTQRAYLRLARGELVQAEEDLRLAEQSNPGEITQADIKMAHRILDEYRAALNSTGNPPPHIDLVKFLPTAPWMRNSVRLDVADKLLNSQEYDWLELVVKQLQHSNTNKGDSGNILYFAGALQWGRGQYDEAYQTFVEALKTVEDHYFRASILFKMAEYHALQGDRQKAVELAEESAKRVPKQNWMLRRIGTFLLSLDEQEKGLYYFEQAKGQADSHEEKALTYSALAEIHQRKGDQEKYLEYAGKFIEEMTAASPPVAPSLEALLAYYQGEIHQAQGDLDQAYNYFELASRLTVDKYRLSDIYMRLSDFNYRRGDREKAIAYARQSADLLPGQAWKLRQVGIALVRLGQLEEGAGFIVRSQEMDSNPRNRAIALAVLADGYKRGGFPEEYHRYAREYIDVLGMVEAPTPNEKGLAEYFQGEILRTEGNAEQAFLAYGRASGLLTDKYYLSDAYIIMAEHEAKRGEKAKAAEYAEKAAALLPEEYWRLLQIGELFTRLGMPEKALEFLTANTQGTAARGYAAMAEAYKQSGDEERYVEFAQRYIDELGTKESLTPEEEGQRAFYEGEIYASRNDAEQAYLAYERASKLLKDKFRLAAVYEKMAAHKMGRGDAEAAAALAEKSAEVLADQGWKLHQVGTVLVQLNRPTQAIEYFDRALSMAATPERKAVITASLADAYNRMGDPEKYLEYARQYGEAIAENGRTPSEPEEGLWAFYQGEMLASRNELDEALGRYEQAVAYLTDKPRLADTHLRLANIQLLLGNKEGAAREAEKISELYPEQAWRQQQVGDIFVRLDMPARATEYFDRARALDPRPTRDAAIFSALADAYRKQGDREKYLDFAQKYSETITADDRQPTEAEEGLGLFYRGEILASQGDLNGAFTAYERASHLVKDKFRLAEIYSKMADHQVKQGNRELAVKYMEYSVALLPDVGWKLREAGNLYTRLDLLDQALDYHQRALGLAATPADKAASYAGLAEVYRKLRKQEDYLSYARSYLETKREYQDRAACLEDESYVYYQAEVYASEGLERLAFEEYERASHLAKDPSRLSDIYVKMALYLAKQGNIDKASEYMEYSIALFPNQVWKLRQAGDFYFDHNLTDKAIEYYERALELASTPSERASLYMGLAESHKKKRESEAYLSYAAKFIQALAERGGDLTPAEEGFRSYYQGELFAAEGKLDEAHREYERASALITTATHLSDIFYKLAQYHAKGGEKEQAVDYIEKSVAFYPESSWKLRQAGEVYFSMDMLDKAIGYFERALEYSTASSTDSLASYGELAEIYKRLKQRDKYLAFAEKYVEAANGREGALTNVEEGLRAFYSGEVLASRDELESAHDSYTRAATFFQDDASRLSDSYIRMAEYEARFGDRELAAKYGEASVALLPTRSYRLQEGGDLFRPMDGKLDRAIELYTGAVQYATSLTNKAAATSALADSYKRKGDTENYNLHARNYIDLIDERGIELTDEEKGLYHYYSAELSQQDEHYERAYNEYAEASKYVTEKVRLADIYLQMAEHQATHENLELGIVFAELSACLLVDQSWNLRLVGNFFARHDKLDKALCYFDEAMKQAKTPHDEAGVHMGRADAYRTRANQVSRDEFIREPEERARLRREMNEKFIEHAYIYIETVHKMEDPTDTEIGLKWFYCGLTYLLRENEDAAYKSFELANSYLKSKFRRSETLLHMARLNSQWDNDDLAYAQACESASLMPGAGWRISELAKVLVDIEQYQAAKCILWRALELKPTDNISLNREMALAFVEGGDKETGMCYNRKYIDYMSDIITERGGTRHVPRKHLDEWWDARRKQARWSKSNWEVDQYFWFSRRKNNNRTLGGMLEVTRNFKWWNNRSGKVYAQLGGTADGHYEGYYWNESRWRNENWQSDQDLEDSLYVLLGFRVSPFKKFADLSMGFEKVWGLGRNVEDDFRFRLIWDYSRGTETRPYGRAWGYTKAVVDNIYSFEERNFTSDGSFRKGITTVPFCSNPNLLIIPYLGIEYDFGGAKTRKHDRFGMEGGPGVLIRQWFRDDRYHTPRSYAQLNVYYRFAITSNRSDGWGLGLHISF